MTDRPNIYASDAAREAAAIEIWEFGVRKEIAREYANAAIDAFLSKAIEGADEKLAEIAARIKRAELHENESICFKTNEASELLTLVTALSAKAESWKSAWQNEVQKSNEAVAELESQLTAQKAAHAKMMRDRAAEWDTWGTSRIDHKTIATEYRRLADKIEGGE